MEVLGLETSKYGVKGKDIKHRVIEGMKEEAEPDLVQDSSQLSAWLWHSAGPSSPKQLCTPAGGNKDLK